MPMNQVLLSGALTGAISSLIVVILFIFLRLRQITSTLCFKKAELINNEVLFKLGDLWFKNTDLEDFS